MSFQVSVIIPVFNSEKYLEKSVQSALDLPEVLEVILIEDGSTDDSLKLCKALSEKEERVRLLQHPNQENRGVSSSRNLGIKSAKAKYVAFLDADDWYLPNRFKAEKDLVSQGKAFDGIYGATGFFEEENGVLNTQKLTTIPKKVKPQDLVMTFLDTTHDRFTTDAITFRKSFLDEIGYFNERMRLREDTHLWIRAAALGNIEQGLHREAVAIRRVHDSNSSRKLDDESMRVLYSYLYHSLRKNKKVRKDAMNLIFRRYIGTQTFSPWKRALLATTELGRRPYMIDKVIFRSKS
ncbi:glycosyltransferase family 2 protein [Algoriphagus sediminis]|uniref:Glycosyltransferase family A protein n=1 Tax=Algoriphagus sediminis TaxID=3057113 RepID=A0ABT7YDV4_9BACT|nr:glycosyltransferase family A protein [Algoriphagus sediminis]MDN3204712.1 glycosyltransferase family A protein [Algoriphagus sediminis]